MSTQFDHWSGQDVEKLKFDWNERGLSAGIIAKETGRTREAVCAKVSRLRSQGVPMASRGVAKRTSRTTAKSKRAPQPVAPVPVAAIAPKPVAAKDFTPAPIEAPVDPKKIVRGAAAALIALRGDQCRWPIGDTRDPDFCFCSGTKVLGLSYCETHARDSFRSARQERDEDASETEANPSSTQSAEEKEDA